MKSFLIGLFALLVGAVIGVFIYTRFVPLPNDAIARGVAFEGDKDWFYQHASEVYPTRTVSRSETAQTMPVVDGLLDGFTFEYDGRTRQLSDLYTDMETSGLIILHKGRIIHESYGRGANSGTRLTTWSLVKSITSTLVGFTVADGLVASVDDPLSKYLPELAETDYAGVTIKQALQMSSGIRFDPNIMAGDMSDTVRLITESAVTGKAPAFDIAKSFKREHEPGIDFNYNTAESQILIELIRRVTGMDAAQYLEQKLWRPLGMEHDAGWIIDAPGPDGAEIGGAMFNASLRDWARFGQFIKQNGQWQGEQLLPADWVTRATTSDEDHLMPGQVHPNGNRGYAWHWWTFADGTFTASGANGQSLYIDDANDIVVARSSSWPLGYVRKYDDETFAMYKALPEWLAEDAAVDDSAIMPVAPAN